MYKISVPILICFFIISCNAINNPFKEKTVSLTSFCNSDLKNTVELERMSFKLPALWGNIKPCQSGKVIDDLVRDRKIISARALKFENNTYYSLGSMDIRVKGDLNLIGKKLESPDEWMARQKLIWKKSHRNDYPDKRNFQKIILHGLDCWKINKSLFYHNNIKSRLIGKNIEYVCWDPDAKDYPPISISAGISYKMDKPVFNFNINKDLILPVFKSLRLKKLSHANFTKRLNEFKNKSDDRCTRIKKRYKKYRLENKYQNFSENSIDILKGCGYDTTSIREWWCRETIRDSKNYNSRSQYYIYPEKLTQNLKSCSK